MTTVPATTRPPQQAAMRGAAPPVQGGGVATPTIDPIKLLKKYAWLLILAGIIGIAAGFGIFQILRQTRPVWTSRVIFEALPAPARPDVINPPFSDDERTLLISNQAERLRSTPVLEETVLDPRLRTEAPQWRQQFVSDTGQIAVADAMQDLRDRSGVVFDGTTSFFTLEVGYREPGDARGLAKLLKENFLRQIEANTNATFAQRTDDLRTKIQETQEEVAELTRRRDQRLAGGEVLGDQSREVGAIQLQEIASQLNEAQTTLTTLREQESRLEGMAAAEPGEPFEVDDAIREEVAQLPSVARLQERLRDLELVRQNFKERGVAPAHRDYQRNENDIRATRTKLEEVRQEEMEKQVFSRLEIVRQAIRSVQAEIADFQERREELQAELAARNQLAIEIATLEQQIERFEAQIAQDQARLAELRVIVGDAATAGRVTVVQAEQYPDELTSPKLPVTVAATFILVVGLTGSLVVARELLDQRVKGPSDVTIIPRTSVLGFVPLAAEDPANPEHIETIFRDQPRGVLSESIRQLRTAILKKLSVHNQKTLLFAAGAPGSGASSMISNLALACAAVDKRVLIVDANFRRPGMHRVFGLEAGPGLSDVLAGQARLAETVQAVEGDRLDVLSAGSAEHRVFERLGTGGMAAVLAEASERYDLVFVDVAPAVVAGDALTLSTLCDASVLVVRALSEKRGMVARLKNELSDARAEFLGVIVNGVRAAAGGYMRRNIRTTHEYQAANEADLDTSDRGKDRGKKSKGAKPAAAAGDDGGRGPSA